MSDKNINPKVASYRETFEEYKKQTLNSEAESGLKHSIYVGIGATIISFVVLLFLLDGLLPTLLAVIIGVASGYFGGVKEREFTKFINKAKDEYSIKVSESYNSLISELKESHTEVFKDDSVIGFQRNEEVYIITNFSYPTTPKLHDSFLELAVDQVSGNEYLKYNTLITNLNNIIRIQKIPTESLEYVGWSSSVILLGSYGSMGEEDEFYKITYRQDGLVHELFCFGKVADYLQTHTNLNQASTNQSQFNAQSISSATESSINNQLSIERAMVEKLNPTSTVEPSSTPGATKEQKSNAENQMEALMKLQELNQQQLRPKSPSDPSNENK